MRCGVVVAVVVMLVIHSHFCSSPGRRLASHKARLLTPQWRLEHCTTPGLEVQGISAVAV